MGQGKIWLGRRRTRAAQPRLRRKLICRTAFAPAYLLHSIAFRDDKLLLDLLLPELGRLRAVARRPGKKQGGRSHWPQFALLSLQLSGRGELKTVRSLEEQQPALHFHGDFLFSAMYLNELICRIWPQDVGK